MCFPQIVFFASDNGAHLEGGHSYTFFNSTGGLLGHKRSLYEGGMRSPSMVRWPGTISPGIVSDFQWAFWDFMPTAAELSGGTAAANIDGVSIVPTLMGQTQPPKPYVYFTWPGTGVKPKPTPKVPTPPPAPTPVPAPVSPAQVAGHWCQGSKGGGKCKTPVTIAVTGDQLVITPGKNAGDYANSKSGLNWDKATGNITAGTSTAATTIKIVATGPKSFTTSETGVVHTATSVDGGAGGLQIDWTATGGERRHWASWFSQTDSSSTEPPLEVDPRLEPPVPEGWVARQNGHGLLEYHHLASGRISASHPSHPTVAAKDAGYAIRVGDWKGVVASCADSKNMVPSDDDKYEIFNLKSDPFEQHDLASTTEGATQKAALLAVVKAAGVSCQCFQC